MLGDNWVSSGSMLAEVRGWVFGGCICGSIGLMMY